MRTIFQKPDAPECGAASFAMIAGKTLKEARMILFGSKEPGPIGIKRMRDALEAHGRKAGSAKAKRLSSRLRLKDLKGDALINGDALVDGEWVRHWMVWDYSSQTLRDPLNHVRPIRVTSATVFGAQ